MHYSVLTSALLASTVSAWLPHERDLQAFNQTARFEQLGKRFEPSLQNGITKIRGVNFGSWLICEPFFMQNEWSNVMGCSGTESEFDCMRNNYSGDKRDDGNRVFEEHWRTWINADSVQSAHDVGLNTIRIPIGYWSYTDIVDKVSEPFADGDKMLPYLDAVVKKAADLGMYVIIDFHGAPGGQARDAFAGQINTGFYNEHNFERAEKWMSWMTERIHSNPAYSTVGMIEVLNEPVSGLKADSGYPVPGQEPGLVQSYYPGALKAVRDVEALLKVPNDKKLHVQFMSEKWRSGDARENSDVANDKFTAYDDHNYIGFGLGNNAADQTALMQSACGDDRVVSGQDFAITGEWSLTSGDGPWDGDADFFKKFFTAQQQLYEKPGMRGWVFWTWKTDLNDPRWTYSAATDRKLVPTNAEALEKNVYEDVCADYK